MTTYPKSKYKNKYGIYHVQIERIIKQAIADAGHLSEDPDKKIIILKEAHAALNQEVTKLGEKISIAAGLIMEQSLRTTLKKKDIKNAVKLLQKSGEISYDSIDSQTSEPYPPQQPRQEHPEPHQ